MSTIQIIEKNEILKNVNRSGMPNLTAAGGRIIDLFVLKILSDKTNVFIFD